MHIRHTSFTWCAFKNKPYVTVCGSDNWTFRLMRALQDSPASSLSWSVHVKVQHTNTGSLSPFQCWSMSPCLFAPVQAWWRVLSVEILELPQPFYPMVTPKPHWNLFLRWLRKAPKASDRGRGSSFFSSVAPTTQLLSKEPEEQEDREAFDGLTFEIKEINTPSLQLKCKIQSLLYIKIWYIFFLNTFLQVFYFTVKWI